MRIAPVLAAVPAVLLMALLPATLHDVLPAAEVEREFARCVALLQGRQPAEAVRALHEVLRRAPRLPEAHANLGFALLAMGRADEARVAFEQATDLRPSQANAYYGLALAHEARGELDAATGAMRAYLHLSRDASPEHQRRARAALWEWEQQRKR